jgi:glycerol-3-phosphate dehydrogenase
VPRLYPEKHCYIFQNADRRILFVIPYESDFTLIGTTDRDYYGDPGRVSASPEEIDYLCRAASEYLKRPISPSDAVWSYSGVRSLVDDGVSQAPAATRDYVLHLEAPDNQPPALSIFGGKITTYRRLAEAALARLAPYLPPATRHSPGWTGKEPLPGGGFAVDGFDDELRKLATRYPFVEGTALQRMLRAYGTCAFRMLGNAAAPSDLGRVFGAGLTEVEVRYLVREEWAATAEDILWRRSKLGLRFSRDEAANLSAFLAGLLPSSEAGGAPISPAST